MPTFRYDKLVRDGIESLHTEQGHLVESRTLSGDELLDALCDKAAEEANEIRAAKTRDDTIEEIADLQQIVDTIRANAAVTIAEVDAAKKRKARAKGAFRLGTYISTVTIPEGDQMVAYLRRSPDKYPEVSSDDE